MTRVLLGRSSELKELHEIVDLVRSGGSATLVIRGEPGVGKTVLLDELKTLAHDFRVIGTDGIESELQLDYAALHRIVLPFMERIPQLPAPQRDAIEAAFGLSTTARPDQFLVGLATLTLLGDPERTAPLLVVVDDAHWLDRESMAALAFVGRRLQADRVALVFAERDSFADRDSTNGLPELQVKGLAEDPARELLASLGSTPVQDLVATEIIEATAGNPLALTGLARDLSESQLAGLSPLPDPLPTGDLIEAGFARQVQLLPKETQITLLLVASEPTRTLGRSTGRRKTSVHRWLHSNTRRRSSSSRQTMASLSAIRSSGRPSTRARARRIDVKRTWRWRERWTRLPIQSAGPGTRRSPLSAPTRRWQPRWRNQRSWLGRAVATRPRRHFFRVPPNCPQVHGIVPDDSSAPPTPPTSPVIRHTHKRS